MKTFITYRLRATLCAVACALLPALAVAGGTVERIEPPFWWVGMKSDRLQLMVHGDGIGAATPHLAYPGVVIDKVTRVDNRNYLFLDLRVAPDARPGTFDILFRQNGKTARHAYRLLPREKNSAERIGFNTSDVILNLMPDRFANGDRGNDNLPGYHERANRADIDAGRHGGDIQGIVNHLDYFASMGYTAVWPTPLTESNQTRYSYHGYAATDTYKIDPRFGSNEDYRNMVALARKKGIGIIQDIVLNHIGGEHWWMRDMPARDWLTHEGQFVPTTHPRAATGDSYASMADRRDFTAGWFEPNMPDMNQKNPLVATYQTQNTIWWIEYASLSGIRVDTYGYSDAAFLTEWSRRIMEEYPNLNMVGEEWSGNPVIVSYWQRGKVNHDGYVSHMPSMMDYPLHDMLRKALVTKETMHHGFNELYEIMRGDALYPDPMNLVLFEGNHDVSRLFSALNGDIDLYKMAVAYILTMRGIPQFYYGTEILMTSPTHRHDGEFRRNFPGGWAGDQSNAVTGAGLSDPQKAAQAYMKKLMNWRKSKPVIHRGKLMHYAPQAGIYVYFRYDEQNKVMVVMNKNTADTPLATARFHEMLAAHATATDVVSGQQFDLRGDLTLPARSVLILEVK